MIGGPGTRRWNDIDGLIADDAGRGTDARRGRRRRRRVEGPYRFRGAHRDTCGAAAIPGDDIQHDYRPLQVRVADLDGDGVAEIIHVYSSTYTGGTIEQSNALVVMTALSEGDRRGQLAHPGANAIDDSDMAAIRATGYASDAEEHVPGRLDALQVVDGKIIVRFTAAAGSTFCFEKDRARAKLEGCPTPGPHVWRFDWSPGRLQRIQ